MKNLFLFLFLVALLCTVYITQEKKGIEKASSEDEYSRLLDTSKYGDLLEIQTPYNHIKKEGNFFRNFSDGHPVDLKKVNDFLNRISYVRAVKYLEKEDINNFDDFFPDKFLKMTFRFENGTLEYRLGKKLDYSQEFYIQFVGQGRDVVAISKDSLPFEGVIAKEGAHKSDHKYRRIKALFFLPPNFFMKMNLFPSDITNEVISFSNIRNRDFTVDFQNYKTTPNPYRILSISQSKIRFLKKNLEEFKAQRFIKDYKPSKLGKVVGSLKTSSGVFKLYESYDQDKFYYMTAPSISGLYQLKPNEQRKFLFNVQTLWNLKPFEKFNQAINLTIKSGKSIELDLTKSGKKVSHLLELFTSRASYTRDDLDLKQLPKKSLVFNSGEKSFDLFFLKKEVILVEREQKISYHYNRPLKDSISLESSDYRALK
ncbi:hypothetical protein A9Q84_03505 [Halobacteriovorax marinus]|uniref:DUF4340 domain-containing protein n=1 Tax=Halobacteriovorax marinus TaxID=97084 RepID=A0A1Y5F9Z8_9BACT|nr:hypothetical protein A9Q84_03505 [Halobacteriovorax marinus]